MPVSDPSRARRFSLPDLADERVDEAISSFLKGPEQRRGRPGPLSEPMADGNPFAALETRIAWMEALRRETARAIRYRRPSAVMVIAGEPTADTADAAGWLGRVAAPIAHVIQRGIRETDLVTRTGEARFQVLLPETTGREAGHIAERVVSDCEIWLRAVQAPVTLRASSSGTTAHATLDAALDRALEAIEPSPPA
jgi:GGDEF domain-containing protein